MAINNEIQKAMQGITPPAKPEITIWQKLINQYNQCEQNLDFQGVKDVKLMIISEFLNPKYKFTVEYMQSQLGRKELPFWFLACIAEVIERMQKIAGKPNSKKLSPDDFGFFKQDEKRSIFKIWVIFKPQKGYMKGRNEIFYSMDTPAERNQMAKFDTDRMIELWEDVGKTKGPAALFGSGGILLPPNSSGYNGFMFNFKHYRDLQMQGKLECFAMYLNTHYCLSDVRNYITGEVERKMAPMEIWKWQKQRDE